MKNMREKGPVAVTTAMRNMRERSPVAMTTAMKNMRGRGPVAIAMTTVMMSTIPGKRDCDRIVYLQTAPNLLQRSNHKKDSQYMIMVIGNIILLMILYCILYVHMHLYCVILFPW